jgi:uncharacterized protein
MAEQQTSFIQRLLPKVPNFFVLLHEQCVQVAHTAELLVEYMESADPEVGEHIKRDEHEADKIKVRNLHVLNEAFSTPIDREDIYRTIQALDDVVNYCKTTVNEMAVLGVVPDKYCLEMAVYMKAGVDALVGGLEKLGSNPKGAIPYADAARKAERKVEKLYRKAIAELFQGDNYLDMFKRREIYRHLSNAADRVATCANTLHDVVVKIC